MILQCAKLTHESEGSLAANGQTYLPFAKQAGNKQKEMKIQECQISGGPPSTLLGLPDAHPPGIFSTHSFSERSRATGLRVKEGGS
jgi:hypothetical protein